MGDLIGHGQQMAPASVFPTETTLRMTAAKAIMIPFFILMFVFCVMGIREEERYEQKVSMGGKNLWISRVGERDRHHTDQHYYKRGWVYMAAYRFFW